MRNIVIIRRSSAAMSSSKKQFPLLKRMLWDYVWWESKYKEQTKGEGENGKEDKKFLYHKITLSSSDVIFYVPIYASGRRGDPEWGLLSLVALRKG